MADDAMVIFHAVDTNGDGVLSPLELSTRLSDFGMSDDQVVYFVWSEMAMGIA